MNKLTILLIVIIIISVGVAGFMIGAQNSQSVPIIHSNNSTSNDSGNYNLDTTKSTKTTTKPKTNTTVKKNTSINIPQKNNTGNNT